MEYNQDHIDELIGKYLTGQASTQEQNHLQNWEAESVSNAQYLKSMQKMYADAGGLNQWQSFDTDAAWNKLRGKLNQAQGKQVQMKSFSQTWLRVAAAVVVLLVASFLIYNFSKTDNPELLYAINSQQVAKQDTLPDGTKAYLNKNSEIRFSQTKKSGKRVVELKGEAFFEVAPNAKQDFIVQAGELLIEDIGTSFNVKAFEDSTLFEVYVQEGEVRLFTEDLQGIHLKAGESGHYNRSKGTFHKTSAVANVIAYKDKNFSFNDAPLSEVVSLINTTYGSNIVLEGEGLGNCRLFVQFMDEDLETITTIIAETLQLTLRKENNEIILQGKGCSN